MNGRFTILGAGLVLAALGAGLVAPMATAKASDAGKILAAIAAGALVYKLVDDYGDRHDDHYARGYHYRPDYYRPSTSSSRDRRIYNKGYDDGFDDGYTYGWKDGRQVGQREGYRYGYDSGYGDGRQDQRVQDRYGRAGGPPPVTGSPWGRR